MSDATGGESGLNQSPATQTRRLDQFKQMFATR